MKLYAKVINEETKRCEVGTGTNHDFYKGLGMTEMNVEQAYNGEWYLEGYAPAEPVSAKETAVRVVRDSYINNIEWRVSRYRDQIEIDVNTTDTEETYLNILHYMQYLRDYPESSEDWYESNPLDFDSWVEENA